MWVDAEEVVDVTGRNTTESSLALAHSVIEILSGISVEMDITDTGIVSGRNARYLRRAVAFEAVWLDDHPDAASVINTTGVSSDGVSGQHASVHAAYLAPLAEVCLRRLSWVRAPIRVGRARRGPYSDVGNRDSAVRDDQFAWTPIGSSGRTR